MLKRFWNWLVKSSANPANTSLTVKGFLTGLIPLVLVVAPLVGVDLDANTLGSTVDDIKGVVEYALGSVGALLTAAGIIRKIYLTFAPKQQ